METSVTDSVNGDGWLGCTCSTSDYYGILRFPRISPITSHDYSHWPSTRSSGHYRSAMVCGSSIATVRVTFWIHHSVIIDQRWNLLGKYFSKVCRINVENYCSFCAFSTISYGSTVIRNLWLFFSYFDLVEFDLVESCGSGSFETMGRIIIFTLQLALVCEGKHEGLAKAWRTSFL